MRSLHILIAALSICCQSRGGFAAWPFQTGDAIVTSPSVADINGDGTLEIVFGSIDGNCYCLDVLGNMKWATPLYDCFCFPPQLKSSPTLIDLDNEPSTLEIIVGSGDEIAGHLYCLSSDGDVLATFDVETPIHAAPLVTDLENDAELDIIFGHINVPPYPPAQLYRLRVVPSKNGIEFVEAWSESYLTGSSVVHGPACADINGDGIQEILLSIKDPGPVAALFCLDAQGGVLWDFQVGHVAYYNTPAVSDVDSDGLLDVLVAQYNGDLYCLDALTGNDKWMYDHPGASMLHSPGVADIDPLKQGLETIVGSYGADRLYCIDGQGELDWQHPFEPEWTGYSSPAIGDVDRDGDLEIAIGTAYPDVFGVSHMYLFDHEGIVVWGYEVPNGINSSPALADLDGDGFLEIAFGCLDHKFYVLDHQGNTFVPNPNTKPKDLAPWPTYRQNNQRTGFYPGPPKVKPVPGDITGDGSVDVDDLLMVINSWGECPPSSPTCPPDIAPAPKGNGNIDVDDLLMVINSWTP